MTTYWEPSRVSTWLYSRLEPDTTLRTALGGNGRVYDSDIPEGATGGKWLVFQLLSAVPIVCQGPSRAGMDCVYAVKVVGQALPFSALAAALDRIDALLFGVDVTATVGGLSWRFTVTERATESQAFAYVERAEGGTVYRHAGRRWSLTAALAA